MFWWRLVSSHRAADERIHDGDVIDELYEKVEGIETELKKFEKGNSNRRSRLQAEARPDS